MMNDSADGQLQQSVERRRCRGTRAVRDFCRSVVRDTIKGFGGREIPSRTDRSSTRRQRSGELQEDASFRISTSISRSGKARPIMSRNLPIASSPAMSGSVKWGDIFRSDELLTRNCSDSPRRPRVCCRSAAPSAPHACAINAETAPLARSGPCAPGKGGSRISPQAGARAFP